MDPRATTSDASQSAVSSCSSYFPRLAERIDQAAGTLSGGEQQMLAIGRALMCRARGCCSSTRRRSGSVPALAKTVFQVVKQINDDGVTVIIVEQNVGVLPYADRALIMEKGTLIFSGVGDEIRAANLRDLPRRRLMTMSPRARPATTHRLHRRTP